MPNVFLWDHVVHAPLTAASDVQALDVTDYINGVTVNVINLGIFTYNNSSTATADNITVIEPDTGPGRWLIATPNISVSNAILGSLETAGSLSEIPFTALARSLSAETTAAAMRSTLSAAVSGVNNDITSITGLTTSLNPAQGGTGTNNGSNTLTIGASASVSGSNTGDQTTISGNAATATALQTARLINGVSFDGTADITVTAAAGTLTGTTLASNVANTSITGLSTVTSGTWNATLIGTTYGGTGNTTGTATFAPASGITGGTLASNVTASSLTSFGTVPTFNGVTMNLGSNTVAGSLNIYPSGNASGVVNFSATSSPGGFNTNITNAAQAASRTYTIPDAGANASFVMTQGNQTLAGAKTFSTAIDVPSGGMGSGSHTAYAVLCGGTTSTSAVQSVASVGSSGQVLTSNGAVALPTFQAPAAAAAGSLTGTALASNVVSSSLTSFGTSPTLVTPILGVSSATSINFGQQSLNYYEEGSWNVIDASGAGLTFTSVTASYTRIGRVVYMQAFFQFPVTASALPTLISGLPYVVAANKFSPTIVESDAPAYIAAAYRASTTTIQLIGLGDARYTNAQLSGKYMAFSGFYFVT